MSRVPDKCISTQQIKSNKLIDIYSFRLVLSCRPSSFQILLQEESSEIFRAVMDRCLNHSCYIWVLYESTFADKTENTSTFVSIGVN